MCYPSMLYQYLHSIFQSLACNATPVFFFVWHQTGFVHHLFDGWMQLFCLQLEASCLQLSFFAYSCVFELFYLQLELFCLQSKFFTYNLSFFAYDGSFRV